MEGDEGKDSGGSNKQNGPEKSKTWVKFSEEDDVGNSETVVDVDEKEKDERHTSININPAVIEPTVEIHSPSSPANKVIQHSGNLQTIELNNVENTGGTSNGPIASSSSTTGIPTLNGNRRNASGFTNGDVIVSILPVNTQWPWVTPASFRPELVPEELMAPGLTLTVEEYVHAMELLTSDVRFNAYTICYKRLLAAWLSAAFFILLIILFSGVVGIHLFALGISWLIINAAAVFFCMYLKIKINQGLERCMSRVNKLFMKHKLIVGLDDRGRISCHKVHLCFIYFDPNECVKRLEQVLEGSQDRQRLQSQLDAQDVDIVITGAQPTRIPRQTQSEAVFLRYIQRWAKLYLRELAIGKDVTPLHLHRNQQMCPCQFSLEALEEKRAGLGGCCRLCRDLSFGMPNTLAV